MSVRLRVVLHVTNVLSRCESGCFLPGPFGPTFRSRQPCCKSNSLRWTLLFYRGVIHVVVLNVIMISPKRLSAEGEMAATGGAQGCWGETSGLFFCVVAMNFWRVLAL